MPAREFHQLFHGGRRWQRPVLIAGAGLFVPLLGLWMIGQMVRDRYGLTEILFHLPAPVVATVRTIRGTHPGKFRSLIMPASSPSVRAA